MNSFHLKDLLATGQAVEVIPGALYFASLRERPFPVSLYVELQQELQQQQNKYGGTPSLLARKESTEVATAAISTSLPCSDARVGEEGKQTAGDIYHTVATTQRNFGRRLTDAQQQQQQQQQKKTKPRLRRARSVCISVAGEAKEEEEDRHVGMQFAVPTSTEDRHEHLRDSGAQANTDCSQAHTAAAAVQQQQQLQQQQQQKKRPLSARARSLYKQLLHGDEGSTGGGCALSDDAFYWSIAEDPVFDYHPFCADFGPLDLGCMVRFARRLERILRVSAHYEWASVRMNGKAAPSPFTGEPSPASLGKLKGKSAAFDVFGPPPSRPFFPPFSPPSSYSSQRPPLGRTGEGQSEPAAAAAAMQQSRGIYDAINHISTCGGLGASYPITSSDGAAQRQQKQSPRHKIEKQGVDEAEAAKEDDDDDVIPVVFCTSLNTQERTNGITLLGAFCILALKWSVDDVQRRLLHHSRCYPSLLDFRDASNTPSSYPLRVYDVLRGLKKAMHLGWVSISGFDLAGFDAGKALDYSWVVPGKLMAMRSPDDSRKGCTALAYAKVLSKLGVTYLVQLNESLYDPHALVPWGIQHAKLEFEDGTAPADAMLLKFLRVVETEFGETVRLTSTDQCGSASVAHQKLQQAAAAAAAKRRRHHGGTAAYYAGEMGHKDDGTQVGGVSRGMPRAITKEPAAPLKSRCQARSSTGTPHSGKIGAVAVHCRAGLGRTGTLIAVYLMRHYGFSAAEVIGWVRVCRPGSISGVQQQYLEHIERRLMPAARVWTDARLAAALSGGGAFAATSAEECGGGGSGGMHCVTEGQLMFQPHNAAAGHVLPPRAPSPQGEHSPRKKGSIQKVRPLSAGSMNSSSAAEDRYELVEVSALLQDPTYLSHSAIHASLKYPSSRAIAMERRDPLGAAVELQKDLTGRRVQQPRQSTPGGGHSRRAGGGTPNTAGTQPSPASGVDGGGCLSLSASHLKEATLRSAQECDIAGTVLVLAATQNSSRPSSALSRLTELSYPMTYPAVAGVAEAAASRVTRKKGSAGGGGGGAMPPVAVGHFSVDSSVKFYDNRKDEGLLSLYLASSAASSSSSTPVKSAPVPRQPEARALNSRSGRLPNRLQEARLRGEHGTCVVAVTSSSSYQRPWQRGGGGTLPWNAALTPGSMQATSTMATDIHSSYGKGKFQDGIASSKWASMRAAAPADARTGLVRPSSCASLPQVGAGDIRPGTQDVTLRPSTAARIGSAGSPGWGFPLHRLSGK